MTGYRVAGLLLLAALLCGLALATAAEKDHHSSPSSLTAGGDLDGWRLESGPRLFDEDELFEYINGGAEIYHEYGFRSLAVQTYRDGEGRRVTLELFEMADDRAAYGIYSFKRSPAGEAVDLGNEGRFEDYYINFWKGRMLVTLTGLDDDPATVAGLRAIARAVDAEIPGGGTVPALVKALPPEGLIGPSVRYLAGSLGLLNTCPLLMEGLSPFDEAVAGDYDSGCRLLVFAYAGREERERRLSAAAAHFGATPRFRDFRAGNGGFAVTTPEGRLTVNRSGDRRITAALGACGEETAGAVPDSPGEADAASPGPPPSRSETGKPP